MLCCAQRGVRRREAFDDEEATGAQRRRARTVEPTARLRGQGTKDRKHHVPASLSRAAQRVVMAQVGLERGHPRSDVTFRCERLRLGEPDGREVHRRALVAERGEVHDVAPLTLAQREDFERPRRGWQECRRDHTDELVCLFAIGITFSVPRVVVDCH